MNDFYVRLRAKTCFPVDEKLVLYAPGPIICFYFPALSGLFENLCEIAESYLVVLHYPFISIFSIKSK